MLSSIVKEPNDTVPAASPMVTDIRHGGRYDNDIKEDVNVTSNGLPLFTDKPQFGT